MYIVLAPMQGYADFIMRKLFCEIGGFNEVVSEFIRITHTLHSYQTWQKKIPELKNHGKTSTGVLCTVQILGSDAENMANNALMAVKAGAMKIDINFGCPAPCVNRHQGGAVLLDSPELIFDIVSNVRQRLPENIELSAKMLLGNIDTNNTLACADAICKAGADYLTIHARTKIQQYQPPAQWEWFEIIQKHINIPLIANGDIFSVDDFLRLTKMSNLYGIMLGRGVLRCPDLALQIQASLSKQQYVSLNEKQIIDLLKHFIHLCQQKNLCEKYIVARIKQWLAQLVLHYPLDEILQKVRPMQDIRHIIQLFQAA